MQEAQARRVLGGRARLHALHRQGDRGRARPAARRAGRRHGGRQAAPRRPPRALRGLHRRRAPAAAARRNDDAAGSERPPPPRSAGSASCCCSSRSRSRCCTCCGSWSRPCARSPARPSARLAAARRARAPERGAGEVGAAGALVQLDGRRARGQSRRARAARRAPAARPTSSCAPPGGPRALQAAGDPRALHPGAAALPTGCSCCRSSARWTSSAPSRSTTGCSRPSASAAPASRDRRHGRAGDRLARRAALLATVTAVRLLGARVIITGMSGGARAGARRARHRLLRASTPSPTSRAASRPPRDAPRAPGAPARASRRARTGRRARPPARARRPR